MKLKRGSKLMEKRCGTSQSRRRLPTPLASEVRPVEGVEALVELEVFGINVMNEACPPVLLLRNSDGALTLPVPLSPLEAGLTLGQSPALQNMTHPHSGVAEVLASCGLVITQAVFEEIRQQKQMLRLFFKNHPQKLSSLLLPAGGVMSFCLHQKVPVFASKEFIQKSQLLVSELQGMAEGLKLKAQSGRKGQVYLQ